MISNIYLFFKILSLSTLTLKSFLIEVPNQKAEKHQKGIITISKCPMSDESSVTDNFPVKLPTGANSSKTGTVLSFITNKYKVLCFWRYKNVYLEYLDGISSSEGPRPPKAMRKWNFKWQDQILSDLPCRNFFCLDSL